MPLPHESFSLFKREKMGRMEAARQDKDKHLECDWVPQDADGEKEGGAE